MTEYIIEGLVSVQSKSIAIVKQAVSLIESGKPAKITVEEYNEEKEKKSAAKARSTAQNRLIYKGYQRIGKTLYGGDESHARNECKLMVGCRILYRDNAEFAQVFDDVIRPLSHEKKLSAMLLLSVSSIMTTPQATEYIKTIFAEYSQRGCYFLDLEGCEQYINYPEVSQ